MRGIYFYARVILVIIFTFVVQGRLAAQDKTEAASAAHEEKTAHEEKYQNKLIDETSPYLLSHAHNPVNWYPWSEEALRKARDENKIIFLSVGYSSCHWCHVMEKESFMDEEIAKFMNDHFVCIKVDREERPDIDSIYMTSLMVYMQLSQAGRRGGGWPLSMFLTPEAKPFFGGTYFPPRDGDRGVRAGFFSVVKNVSRVWEESPDRIESDAQRITSFTLRELSGRRNGDGQPPEAEWVSQAVDGLQRQFDPLHGGFGFAEAGYQPKFPQTPRLLFLVEELKANPGNNACKNVLTTTLDGMMLGGCWDHLGGGFHRYSVDRFWRIPHFEKMLYDNAQLASVYAEAYEVLGFERYRFVVDEIAEFVRREMTSPEGGFYSALDADSEGEEGKFYRWEKEEIVELLTEDEFALVAPIYGLDREPNFEDEYYAIQLRELLTETASGSGKSVDALRATLKKINDKLLVHREKRVRPLTDDKVLTSWNGLMIRGLADAGRILKNQDYIQRASTAADFIWDNMRQSDGRLFRTYSQGKAKLNGYIDDYAFLIDGMLALHRATEDEKWLKRSIELQATQHKLFWDETRGGYFFTSNDHEKLIARAKERADRAMPAGNSVAIANLNELYRLTENAEYKDHAIEALQNISGLLSQYPWVAARVLKSVRDLAQD